MSRAWRNGSGSGWRRTRALVLARNQVTNGGRCTLKLDGCTTIATDAHHTVGREITGDNPQYLVASCSSCNGKVGNPRRFDPEPRPRTAW